MYSALGRLRQENYKVQITSPHTEFQAANSTLKEKKDFFSQRMGNVEMGSYSIAKNGTKDLAILLPRFPKC